MDSTTVNHISECFIKPKFEFEVEGSNQPYHIGPKDVVMLSAHYIQKGLLYTKPTPSSDQGQNFNITTFIESLKDSLSRTLVHFYPLAGQLATEVDQDRHQCVIFVDCSKGPGARFIHASLDLTISDILSPTDVPLVVQSFFDHDRAVNHDGHTRPLLTVQVTELLDGIFIGCSMNHSIGDGTSYWHFWNTWSEIHTAGDRQVCLARLPVHKRWCLDGYNLPIPLPFTHPDEVLNRYEAPKLRERIFHFSSESIARLKARANKEGNTSKISSFQALSAHVWRSVVRVYKYQPDQITICRLVANNRHRIDPPLPQEYFGNAINTIETTATAGELVGNNLGWAALLLNQTVSNHTGKVLCDFVEKWLKSPFILHTRHLADSTTVHMGSSPRFDMYGNEFGLGKAVAVLSGYANKFEGKVSAFPGYEGGGSIDLELCLSPDSMGALEADEEFMAAVSLPCNGY